MRPRTHGCIDRLYDIERTHPSILRRCICRIPDVNHETVMFKKAVTGRVYMNRRQPQKDDERKERLDDRFDLDPLHWNTSHF